MAVLLRGIPTAFPTSHPYFSDCNSNKRRNKSHGFTSWRNQACHSSFMIYGLPGVGCLFMPRNRNNLVTVSSVATGFVCIEEGNILERSREARQTFNGYEGVPGKVAPTISKEINMDPRSNLCPSNSNKRIDDSRIKLHFLEERDEEILSHRILNLSRSNKVRSALELYASMQASGLQPNAHACNSLLSCLVRHKSVDDALNVFETMRKAETATGHTYSLILKAVASVQGCDSALEIFRALEEEEASMKNFDVIVYNTMISACGKEKNWVESVRLWRSLKQNALHGTTITYSLLISTFVQCGQIELALDAYHEMIQKGSEPGEDIMKVIATSCAKEGKWTVALNVFQKLLDSGVKPNIITYNEMINCLGKAGEADLAFRVYGLMKSAGHTPDAYTWNALLTALYRCHRYADALGLFLKIREEHNSLLNVHLYNTALMSCQKLSLWERSLQLLWQMETSGILMLTESYNHVIRACEVARKPKVALQVYRHMIQQKCAPDTFTYLTVIRACVWGSLWIEVEEILENVEPSASLYNALIHGFCLRGKVTLAKKLYMQMRKIGLMEDGKTRAMMLQYLQDDKISQR